MCCRSSWKAFGFARGMFMGLNWYSWSRGLVVCRCCQMTMLVSVIDIVFFRIFWPIFMLLYLLLIRWGISFSMSCCAMWLRIVRVCSLFIGF